MKSIRKRFAKVRIVSVVTQYGADETSTLTDAEGQSGETETMTLTTDCTVAEKGDRIEIEYEETELTGMEGAHTKLLFDRANRGLVSLLREGSVSTALVFEEGRRHTCTYNTPYFPIELRVETKRLSNTITFDGGVLRADYLIEMNGMLAERTQITVALIG